FRRCDHPPVAFGGTCDVVWSKNPIRMKSKDDGSRGPCGPDESVTPRYITKKSPRNVQHGVLETSLTISRVFSKFEFFDYTGIMGSKALPSLSTPSRIDRIFSPSDQEPIPVSTSGVILDATTTPGIPWRNVETNRNLLGPEPAARLRVRSRDR